jgi:hypothetical protein
VLIASLLSLACLATESSAAETIALTPTTEVRFASVDAGRMILTANDAFTKSLSRFDLQCRLKTDKHVSLDDWKHFTAEHVRAWEPDEMATVCEALQRLKTRLADLRLPLPSVIQLIRTTGDEENHAAYTRDNAIVLPKRVLSYDQTQLDRLLAHELFHLLSRHDGAVRARLYKIIGFEVCEPIEMPASLAARRVTNPDAPLIDCTMKLPAKDGATVVGAPILYSQTKDYDAKSGKSLFQSFVFRLLVVERQRENGPWRAVLKKGQPVVINPREEQAFLDKIGQNTNYIIHPDEILADNFVRLVMHDQNVPTPRIVDDMRRVLQQPVP